MEDTIAGAGVYNGISATGVSIGGLGHAVNLGNGLSNFGSITAKADTASATALNIGAATTAPQIVNTGSILAEGGGANAAVQAISIDATADVRQCAAVR